jgi:hypothetical protein
MKQIVGKKAHFQPGFVAANRRQPVFSQRSVFMP